MISEQLSVMGGIGVLDGHPVRWEDTVLDIEPNRAWISPRVDLVVLGPRGLSILSGIPALWSRVPPECPVDRLPILVHVTPPVSRGLWERLRARLRC